jgi:hypothetical protein
MKKFKLVDCIVGWVVFAIAAFVYCSTIEPTASFWDCPEFITTAYKLEIGHPPGAPFFALTANLFTQFVHDPTLVAKMVNTMSALLSATCIMFLFWTISHLTRKLIVRDGDAPTLSKAIAIEGSGLVGALIYCFSDTFWFSAVEGEVYAYSSAFTAVVFWLILKWEDHADDPHSDRWLVLITYMTGLSIGVHLLNLLCIPAIVLVFYYKKCPDANLKGSILALLVSFVLVAAVLYGVVPGIITVGGWFELFFTNTLGLAFNTGTIVYLIVLVASVLWAIYETYTNKSLKRENIAFLLAVALLGIPFYGYGIKAFITGVIVLAILWFVLKKAKNVFTSRVKNTALLCMLMLMIGYSSYALIIIRSTANPPMDQNSPEDIFTLGNYLSRDQYGDRPLFYGQAYSSQLKYEPVGDGMQAPVQDEGAPIYEKKEKASAGEPDSYFIANRKSTYEYEQNMFFPRMYDAAHAQQYESWLGGVKGRDVDGVTIPTQGENLRFFVSYQCNFMYWRYFMWNFCGRQNDIQGNGELEHGNWITGIPFIDNAMYGDQSKLPDQLKKYDAQTNPSGNKGHNVYYGLPLLLGLIGLFWQAFRGKRGIQQFWVVCFLFLMTGLAIVFYLNQTPSQPRERDYAYAGSFYAFAIWCGLGVAAIIDWLKKIKIQPVVAAAVVSILALFVPIQMGSQNWDDHDRSNRYTCRDFGRNYLMSLQPKSDAIIFTNGDNDTFPLWYNQEVEGQGTDFRVCNLSYLSTDWYIDQMMRPAYESTPAPITWKRLEYVTGTNEYVRVDPSLKDQVEDLYKNYPQQAKQIFGDKPFELKNVLKYWVRNDFTPQQKTLIGQVLGYTSDSQIHDNLNVIPTDTLFLTVDKNAVMKSGMQVNKDSIPDEMVISLAGKNALIKSNLMMLEMLSNANWTRPLYIASTVGNDAYAGLGDNLLQEGLAYRIVPYKTDKNFNMDVDKTYDAVMNRFRFGGLSRPGLYIDQTVMRLTYTHRRLMATLAINLAAKNEKDKAVKVLQKMEKEIPYYNIPIDVMGGSLETAQAWYLVGNKQKAEYVVNQLWKNAVQYAEYYLQLDERGFNMSADDCAMQIRYVMPKLLELTQTYDPAWCKAHQASFQNYAERYSVKTGGDVQ